MGNHFATLRGSPSPILPGVNPLDPHGLRPQSQKIQDENVREIDGIQTVEFTVNAEGVPFAQGADAPCCPCRLGAAPGPWARCLGSAQGEPLFWAAFFGWMR